LRTGFVDGGSRIAVAAAPELLDESVALRVSLKLQEDIALFLSDDVDDILFEPFAVVVRGLFPLLFSLEADCHRKYDQAREDDWRDPGQTLPLVQHRASLIFSLSLSQGQVPGGRPGSLVSSIHQNLGEGSGGTAGTPLRLLTSMPASPIFTGFLCHQPLI
jgi:hypothetical protein